MYTVNNKLKQMNKKEIECIYFLKMYNQINKKLITDLISYTCYEQMIQQNVLEISFTLTPVSLCNFVMFELKI